MKKTTIFLVRHAESIGNAHYINGGKALPDQELGTDLSELGLKQARSIAQEFENEKIDAIYSSDYLRALSTAEIIAKKHNLKVIINKNIRERNLGSMEGKITPEVRAQIKKLQEKMTDIEKIRYKLADDVESEEELLNRFLKFLRNSILEFEGKTILIVGHANVMRVLLFHLKKFKYDQLVIGSIENAGYIKLEAENDHLTVKRISGITPTI